MAYEFVDTTETGENTGFMSITTTFNGVNLDRALTDENGEFTTLTVNGRRNTSNRIKTLGITGLHGVYEEDSTTVEPREPSVKFRIRDKTNEGFAERLTRLNSLLRGVKHVLEFDDEPLTYYATVAEIDIPEEESNDLIGTITFFCSDPFKYGTEEGYDLNDITAINNTGIGSTEPVFELTALKKTTFAMISKEAEIYNLVGKDTDVDEKVVNEKTQVLFEQGETLNTWTSTGTKTDSASAKVQGKLGTDGTGILPISYGSKTSNKWYGPALIKEITPIQDFEIEMRMRAKTNKDSDVYRIEFYMFDENMESLGKMAVWDNSTGRKQFVAEARYGEFRGPRNHDNYPISSKNHKELGKHFHGMARVRRRGKKWEFYFARLTRGETDTGKHFNPISKTFIDVNNEYQKKLKFVQIHIGTHDKGTEINLPRINNFEVSKFNTIKVDETPYILDAGDIVVFDHENRDILINGETKNELKDFGGEFFTLDKGLNNLVIGPEDSFESIVRFKPKHL